MTSTAQGCARCPGLWPPAGGHFRFSVWALHRCQPAAEGNLEPVLGDVVLGFRGDPVEPPQQLWKERFHPELFTPTARRRCRRGPRPAGSHPGGKGGTVPLPGSRWPIAMRPLLCPSSTFTSWAQLGPEHLSGDVCRAPSCWHPLTSTLGQLCSWVALGLPKNGRVRAWPWVPLRHGERGPRRCRGAARVSRTVCRRLTPHT